MKGDLTRSTFRSQRHYHSVRMQQGRVQLDADWNEQADIALHLDETTRVDVIGPDGAPREDPGFGIEPLAGPDLAISPGRIYVDGILCELRSTPTAVDDLRTNRATLPGLLVDDRPLAEGDWLVLGAPGVAARPVRVTSIDGSEPTIRFAPSLTGAQVAALTGAGPVARRIVSYTTQPDLPGADHRDETGRTLTLHEGNYLAYLDVWRRHITALEDPGLLESALGGPDTATRLQALAQVKLIEVPDDATGSGCDVTWPQWEDLIAPSTGALRARAVPEEDQTTLCELPPRAGYRRLENQLYRVEVHDPGALGGATFKWSRDNGSIVWRWLGTETTTRLQLDGTGRDAVTAFAPGEMAELSDDGRDLRGEPGRLVEVVKAEGDVLTVADPVDFSAFGPGAKVRRWNNPRLETVAVAADNDGYLPLEDGVEVRFESGSYRTGDHWLIPARTLQSDVDWPRDGLGVPQPKRADGIHHGYARLATLQVDGAGVPTVVDDCRDRFPSLTEICADDICYDNTVCRIPDADTVQDALDHLCERSDHRFHNKHLHGWGIVCGLQVHCGGDDGVVVRDGYAIDCEGNDIVVGDDVALDLLAMIDELDAETGEAVLDENGDGEVCLTIGLDDDHNTGFEIEPYTTDDEDGAGWLNGTLLFDFYRNCIEPLRTFLEREIENEQTDDGCIATGRRLLAALTNVLTPALNQQAGHSIFVSRDEHELVLGFYERLRELLRSETFCAMFDNARPFPDYPLDDLPIRTLYGKGFHTRLRARPGGQELYTVGAGVNPITARTRINRYDIERGCLVAEIDPLAGGDAAGTDTGAGSVEDVAFSPDGRTIHMIARARSDRDTYFRSGTIGRDSISWGPLHTLCGARLVTLAVTGADPRGVYAVGLAERRDDDEQPDTPLNGGLFRIDPAAPEDEPAPVIEFNAVGHLVIDPEGQGAATASSKQENGSYDQARLFEVRDTSVTPRTTITYETSGTDDIAIHPRALRARRPAIYAVIGRGNGKRIVAHDLNTGRPIVVDDNPAEEFIEDTTVRLEPMRSGLLLRTLEDHYSVRMLDPDSFSTVGTAVPMQVGPIAITTTGDDQVAVLNFASNTITMTDDRLFAPDFTFPHDQLAKYKRQALEAFADLAGGLLQYFKDCLCDQFLVNCPEWDEDAVLYLACISIRNGRVYKVCNFSKRREVKSWPKVGYWASILPIMPLLDRAVEWFCCLILPDAFGRYQAEEVAVVQHTDASGVGLGQIRGGVATTQQFDLPGRTDILRSGSLDSARAVSSGLAMPGGFARAFGAVGRAMGGRSQPGFDMVRSLTGVPVRAEANETNPFEPLLQALRTVTASTPRAGPRPAATTAAGLQEEVRSLADSLAARDTEVAELRVAMEDQRALRNELEQLKTHVQELRER